MKILAFGSRTMRDAELVELVIEGLQRRRPGTEGFTLVHGAAKGADTLAAEAARKLEWSQVRAYPADWKSHGMCSDWCREQRRCKAAGVRRNQEMLDREHTAAEPIDLAVGFIDKPLTSSRGTHDMFKRLRTAEVAIWMIWAPFYRGIDTFQEPPWDRGNHRAPARNRSVQVPPRR